MAEVTVVWSSLELPQPDMVAQRHSEALRQQIIAVIERNADMAISFAEYMQMALYQPELGYYVAGTHKLGHGGDFTTAPELSPLFSYALANRIASYWPALTQHDILEFGAGSGAMANAILQRLQQLEQLPNRYYIIELSPQLRQRQLETIQPEFHPLLQWLDTLPTVFAGVVVANELLDAIPCERFIVQQGEVLQQTVCFCDSSLQWGSRSAPTWLAEAVQPFGLSDGYVSELHWQARLWLRQLAELLTEAVVILIDYGESQQNYYDLAYPEGRLRCFYQQRVHSDPFWYPGLQDITSHVNFTAIADTALESDLQVRGFCNQGSFLLAAGITELWQQQLEQCEQPAQRLQLQQQLQTLTAENQMGEIFKVMVLAKGVDSLLPQPGLRDERYRL